jgi:hypothetical protein
MRGSAALSCGQINDGDAPSEFFSDSENLCIAVCFLQTYNSYGLDVRERASVLRVQTQEMWEPVCNA